MMIISVHYFRMINTIKCRKLSRIQNIQTKQSDGKTPVNGQLSIGYRSYGNQTWPIKWNAVSYKQRLSILLYGCTTWTLTKRLEKKLDGNFTRMLRAILNKSWRQHPQSSSCTATYHPSRKISKSDEPDMQDTAGEVGTSS